MIRIRKARILSACVAALLTIALNAGCSGRTDKASDSATAPENAAGGGYARKTARQYSRFGKGAGGRMGIRRRNLI